ncbi:MAG: efflux RND transporter permease subunit, partial [Steroidobacteraceae bacterium]
FIPLAFLSGVTGAFFKFLSITMASALIISFILTALIVPLLMRGLIDFSRWMDPNRSHESWMTRTHAKALRGLFARPFIIAIGIAVLAAAGVFAYRHVGSGFLPRMDEGGFVLDYQTQPVTSLAESNRELEEVESILKASPYVYTYSRRTGAGLGGDLKETYQGDFFVKLIPVSKRPALWTVMDQLNTEITNQVPGILLDPHQLLDDMINDMVGLPQPVVIKLTAKDPAVLDRVAAAVADTVSRVKGVVADSVDSGVIPAGDALEVRVDPAAAATQDITPTEVQNQLDHYLYGVVVTKYLGTDQDVGVRLRLDPPTSSIYRDELGGLLMRSPDGHVFPLRTVAHVSFAGGQPEITRDNLAQIVAVTAEIGGAYHLGRTVDRVKQAIAKPGLLPAGVTYTIGGEYKQQQLALQGMIKVFAAGAIAEFLLLLFLYNEFWLPVIIIGSAIVSSGAVFIGLWVTGTELNITAMMGMVMIIGIATEMAIFLASEYQALRETMPPHAALQHAAVNRLRPILMSTLAMVLALLPLGAAISGSGDQMLQPLAIAIIAGIIVQLPLVLLAMPVVIGLTVRQPRATRG